ncbi:MAG: hypothetical protein IT494_05330 [Gammaproteobacteria bacterium]|nr:hypothetical protein [Gammaproteobacteria bacterium]
MNRLGRRRGVDIVLLLTFILAATTATAQRQRTGGLNQEQLDELSHKHDGYYGALAPQNLAAPRPKPPFDLTSTWFIDLRRAFSDFMFGPPYPEFFEPGQTALREAAEARAAGRSYRDSIGRCYPAGMPMIMTRVWPIAMIQLPTAIYQVYGFTNSLRIIYLDGRQHTDPDLAIPTYNGESIGRWEGDELVVHTKYFETNEHWIDSGIPISDAFEIVERYRLVEDGTMLEIEFTLTDPNNWKGEWKSTKRWLRSDYSDIPEVECLPNLNEDIPGTDKGQAETERREREATGAR